LSSFEYNFEFAEEFNFDVGSGPTVCAPSPRGIVTQLPFIFCMIDCHIAGLIELPQKPQYRIVFKAIFETFYGM
jgi:hypothetical protein